MEPKISEFGLVDFLIQESHIVRYPSDNKGDLEIKIKPSGVILSDHFELNLEIEITEPGRLEIKLIAIGIFQFSEKVTLTSIPSYFTINAPAIIFPYIRAYIVTLTANSGHETITIPVLNLAGIQNELKENIQVMAE